MHFQGSRGYSAPRTVSTRKEPAPDERPPHILTQRLQTQRKALDRHSSGHDHEPDARRRTHEAVASRSAPVLSGLEIWTRETRQLCSGLPVDLSFRPCLPGALRTFEKTRTGRIAIRSLSGPDCTAPARHKHLWDALCSPPHPTASNLYTRRLMIMGESANADAPRATLIGGTIHAPPPRTLRHLRASSTTRSSGSRTGASCSSRRPSASASTSDSSASTRPSSATCSGFSSPYRPRTSKGARWCASPSTRGSAIRHFLGALFLTKGNLTYLSPFYISSIYILHNDRGLQKSPG